MVSLQTPHRLTIALAMALTSACAHLDSDTEERQIIVAPVEAEHLQVEWCPQDKRIRWKFAFGETPDWKLNASPPEWPGPAGYRLPRAAGGQYLSHFNGTFQYTPHFWVYSAESNVDHRPPFLEVRISVPEQLEVKAKFILGEPSEDTIDNCVRLPVLAVRPPKE